jgi:uncharacterized membrane protein
MFYLIAGLFVFLGVHSVRIFADGWRTQTLKRAGEGAYKGLYSLASVVGLGLIIYGFGVARETPVMLWAPPTGMRHAASLLTLVSFILLAAAYVPRNSIKSRLHHPMVLGVKSWALAHLISNGSVAHSVLFGAFLAWGVANFVAARRRDRVFATQYPQGTLGATAITVVLGVLVWAAFAFKLHGLLIGIRPFG